METGLRIPLSEDVIRPQMLQLRDFRPFKSSDEYLWAMKEDLSDWLLTMYPELLITPNTFMECLETGITICKVSKLLSGMHLMDIFLYAWHKLWKLGMLYVTWVNKGNVREMHDIVRLCRSSLHDTLR